MFSKRNIVVLFTVLLFSVSLACYGGSHGQCSPISHASLINQGAFYEVVLNYEGASSREVGVEYGEIIRTAVPDYPQLIDSYIREISQGNTFFYQFLMQRVNAIKPQIDQAYRSEIEGLASKLAVAKKDTMGDNQLSLNELYLINLLPDAARQTQCAAMAVFGGLSSTGHTLAGRILDWYQGSQNQLLRIQAVVTFKNGSKSICTVGYLGFMGVISGFNKDKVFAGILDCPTGAAYDGTGKYSYPLDIRYALENCKTLDMVSDFLKTRPYAYSHLIFLADPDTSKVLENNITDSFRQVRTATSALNEGIAWGFENAIGSVNSFLLNGNRNNHNDALIPNLNRWTALRDQLTAKSDDSIVTVAELKEIVSYTNIIGGQPGKIEDGSLYHQNTQQVIIFEPDSLNLEVFFRPSNGLPTVPVFEKVKVDFGMAEAY